MRSPRAKVGGLYHFGRMLDKIRLHLDGRLPEEYQPNFGLSVGLDGHCCGYLGIAHTDLVAHVRDNPGVTDEQALAWCCGQGNFEITPIRRRVWNTFAEKFGWRDHASAFLDAVKKEDGLASRDDILTTFDVIDLREGRMDPDLEETNTPIHR